MPKTIKVRPSSIKSDVGTVAAPVILAACGDSLCSQGRAALCSKVLIYPVVTKVARIPSIKASDVVNLLKNVKQNQQYDLFAQYKQQFSSRGDIHRRFQSPGL
jgi:hypothetical protein